MFCYNYLNCHTEKSNIHVMNSSVPKRSNMEDGTLKLSKQKMCEIATSTQAHGLFRRKTICFILFVNSYYPLLKKKKKWTKITLHVGIGLSCQVFQKRALFACLG